MLYERVLYTFPSFCYFLFRSFFVIFYSVLFLFFLAERLLTLLLLQNGEPPTAVLAYTRSLCSDWTPCYRRALLPWINRNAR